MPYRSRHKKTVPGENHAFGDAVTSIIVIKALISMTNNPSNAKYASLQQLITVFLGGVGTQTYQRGRLRTPFEYSRARTPLRRSAVGYRAKNAGYAAIIRPK